MEHIEMTVSQALIRFLTKQYTVDGNTRERTIPGIFGIFGHGNVSGIAQAISEVNEFDEHKISYHQSTNEQAMVHQAVGFSRMRRRRATYACTASVGPGSTNMLTGAALATTNRLPVLLLPSDTFATRVSDPVLQQIELPHDTSITVNDAFKPLSKFFDRVNRPEQLFSIALSAMRVLTDPAETGAVTICLPEDVQSEMIKVPLSFLAEREWHVRRPSPENIILDKAIKAIKESTNPVIIAGGGVIYSGAEKILADFASSTQIPVATTHAGGGSLPSDHPQYLGGVGSTGSEAANIITNNADLVIGIGTRYSDFTTASRSVFQNPEVKFININISSLDAYKHGTQTAIIADAKETLNSLHNALTDFKITQSYLLEYSSHKNKWESLVKEYTNVSRKTLPAQSEIIGAVNSLCKNGDVVVSAAGSLPGDLHKIWRHSDPLGYHVEYAFSCMGYEIAGGIGVKRADKEREVFVMVGDGSYLMLHSDLMIAVAENIKIIVILVQNNGYASIGKLSEDLGGKRFGTKYRDSSNEEKTLPLDLAANARSYGVNVIDIKPSENVISELKDSIMTAKLLPQSTLIHINSDPLLFAPPNNSWWDVPVAEKSNIEQVKKARVEYVEAKKLQKPLL